MNNIKSANRKTYLSREFEKVAVEVTRFGDSRGKPDFDTNGGRMSITRWVCRREFGTSDREFGTSARRADADRGEHERESDSRGGKKCECECECKYKCECELEFK